MLFVTARRWDGALYLTCIVGVHEASDLNSDVFSHVTCNLRANHGIHMPELAPSNYHDLAQGANTCALVGVPGQISRKWLVSITCTSL